MSAREFCSRERGRSTGNPLRVCVGGVAAEDVQMCWLRVCEGDAVGPAEGELAMFAADIGLRAAG